MPNIISHELYVKMLKVQQTAFKKSNLNCKSQNFVTALLKQCKICTFLKCEIRNVSHFLNYTLV